MDASCSGGNTPWKQITNAQDRSAGNSQDRLVSNVGPNGQGFRTPQPQAPQDAAFQAFQSGNAGLPVPDFHPAARLNATAAAFTPLNHHAPAFHPQQTQQSQQFANGQPAWIRDFQAFSAQEQNSSHARASSAPLPLQQRFQGRPSMMSQAPTMASFTAPNVHHAPLFGPTNGGFEDPVLAAAQRPGAEQEFQNEMNAWMAQHGDGPSIFGEIDAHMEQLARDLELQESAQATTIRTPATNQEAIAEATSIPLHDEPPLTDLNVSELRNLSLSSPPVEQEAPTNDGVTKENAAILADKAKSEVAIAAERLLDSVKDNESDKFQQSMFLALMRDFSEGKKEIVDDKVVDTEAPATAEDATPTDKGKQPEAA